MKFVRHRIVLPESLSFVVNELKLNLNRDIIHSHRNYELNYIDNGRGRRFVGGNIASYEPGDLVLMGPDLPHGWEVDNPDDAPISITIHFQEDLFDINLFKIPEFRSLQKLLDRSRSGMYFKSINPNIIKDYLIRLKELHEFDAIIHLLKILKYLSLVKETQILSSPDYLWNQNQPETERINAVYDYVFRNFHKDIRLKNAAEKVNLSESAFCTFFKKLTRKSFFTFVKEVRIGYACKLLLDNTNMNIAQICFNSGFNNVANFNRQFRELTNMNPREYRIKYAGKSSLTLDGSPA